jgi:ubiquinone/menaquinone biosynthesis C-methylase UbiE
MNKTYYRFNDTIQNEKGWIFYDTNLKIWRKIFNSIIGQKILDIGCGGGVAISMCKLFNPELNAYGFEGTEDLRPFWEKRNIKVKTGNIYKLPFKDAEFDTVFSSHVLEHLDNPQLAIDESIRVSKKRIIHVVPEGNVDIKNFGTKHLKIYNRINFLQHFEYSQMSILSYESLQDTHMNSLFICLEKNEK